MRCLRMGSLKTGIMRSLLKVNCLSGSCFPSAPPYCCQSVSALKSKHSDKEEGTKRKRLSFYVLRCTVSFFFFLRTVHLSFRVCGRWIGYRLSGRSPKLLVCPLRENSGQSRCVWRRQVFTFKNTDQVLNSQAETPHVCRQRTFWPKVAQLSHQNVQKIVKREHRRKDFCRLEEE